MYLHNDFKQVDTLSQILSQLLLSIGPQQVPSFWIRGNLAVKRLFHTLQIY